MFDEGSVIYVLGCFLNAPDFWISYTNAIHPYDAIHGTSAQELTQALPSNWDFCLLRKKQEDMFLFFPLLFFIYVIDCYCFLFSFLFILLMGMDARTADKSFIYLFVHENNFYASKR